MKEQIIMISNDYIVIENSSNTLRYKIGEGLIEFIEYDFSYIEDLIDNYINEFYFYEFDDREIDTSSQSKEKESNDYIPVLHGNSDIFVIKESNFNNILSKLNSIIYLKSYEPIKLAEFIFDRFVNITLDKNFDSFSSLDHYYFKYAYEKLFYFGESTQLKIQLDIDEYYNTYLESISKNLVIISKPLSALRTLQDRYSHHLDKVLNIDNQQFSKLTANQRLYLCKYFKIIDLKIEEFFSARTRFDVRLDDKLPPSLENNPHDIISNIDSFVEYIKKQKVTLTQSLYINNLHQLCYIEFLQMVEKNIYIRKCKNCNKYFIPYNRPDTLYCDRLMSEDGKTCKDVGAMNIYREKIKEDPIMEMYNRVYKKYNARVRYKKITQEDFYNWSEKAREMRDKAKGGEITLDEFKEWLNNDK